MTDIEGSKPITPQARAIYKEECVRGVSLFQKTLQEYQKSQIDAQKAQYKDVMEKALQIIQETAAQCLSQEMQKEQLQLGKDYEQFTANPSAENLKILSDDLQHFQKKL
jgi:hypothetical protein